MKRASALVMLLACRDHQAPPPPPTVVSAPASALPPPAIPSVTSSAKPRVVDAAPAFEELSIPSHPNAIVSIPNGAAAPRPLVVVLHGSNDRPDWACTAWRGIVGVRAWIVCPRGSPAGPSAFSHIEAPAKVADHIDAAIAALSAKYSDLADARDPVLAGFSWGATQATSVIVLRAGEFSRLVLVEGGYGAAQASAAALAKANVVRVLFGAGQSVNDTQAKAAMAVLVRTKIDTRSRFAPVGHTFEPPLQRALAEDLDWLVAGDDRW